MWGGNQISCKIIPRISFQETIAQETGTHSLLITWHRYPIHHHIKRGVRLPPCPTVGPIPGRGTLETDVGAYSFKIEWISSFSCKWWPLAALCLPCNSPLREVLLPICVFRISMCCERPCALTNACGAGKYQEEANVKSRQMISK